MSDAAAWSSVAILALAGFAHGLFGFGFAMIATPLLALFLDYRVAVLLAAVPVLLMAPSWLLAHRRRVLACKVPASLLPAVAVGASCGVALQIALPQRVSLLLLAFLLVICVLTPWFLSRWRIPGIAAPARAAAMFGGLAGATESALNVGAPFMLIYGALARFDRLEQLTVLNLCFAVAKTIQVCLIYATGAPRVGLAALAFGTAASGACYYLGDRVANRFSDARFRKLLRAFLIVMVGALVVRAAWI